ncbi:MAG: T9SS type A sorting domain-containing protein [Ferruginibacter sp.]
MKKFIYILILFIGITFTSFAQSSVQPSQAKMIKFYPNPASSVINFDYIKGYDKSYSLQIFNFMGKRVFELKNTPSRMTIGLDDFFRGIYVFQVRDKNGSIIESGKFQVTK